MSQGRVSGSRYERLLLIGRGGMGEVFLGRQLGPEGFRRPVALKRILPGHGHDSELRRMFVAEARIMAGLGHPNICQTIELCSLDDDLFLVLEYLDGVTVGALMREVGAMPTEVVGALVVQACAGLEHAHARGLVHRDLTPSNLFLTADGLVKILDFGVAKVRGTDTSSSGLKGKSPYMSPEQVSARPLDGRSDLFALGALGLEALMDAPLFLRENDFLTYQAILEDTRPVRLSTSPLDPVLARCLELDPADRPQSARALAQAVRSVLHAEGGELSPHDLAEYVEHHMADALRATRQRVAAALAATTPSSPVVLQTVELPIESLGLARTESAALPPPAPAARVRRSVAIALLLLLALAGAFAIGLSSAGPETTASPAADARPRVAMAADAGQPPSGAAPDAGRSPLDAGAPDAGGPAPPPKPRGTGQVSIDANPFATLWIDGKEVGTTPLLRYSLPEGVHRVRARTQDGRTRTLRIRVRAGKHTVERVSFE